MTKILLDTNASSRLLQGDRDIKDTVERSSAVYISTIVIGELLAAFKGGSREGRNKTILNKFLEQPTVSLAKVDLDTAEYYAQIFDNLKEKGKPIPMNDVWIAASALEMGAVLVTQDRHFTNISGLRTLES